MTKSELVEIVDRVYILWGKTKPEVNQKAFYDVWWSLLFDLDAAEVTAAVNELAATDEPYLPRPGTVRRRTLVRSAGLPSPLQAWNTLQHVREQVNNGTIQPDPNMHPVLRSTLQKTGTNLHTNQDRVQFIDTYEQEMTEWFQTHHPLA
jgi:hypothetical protein